MDDAKVFMAVLLYVGMGTSVVTAFVLMCNTFFHNRAHKIIRRMDWSATPGQNAIFTPGSILYPDTRVFWIDSEDGLGEYRSIVTKKYVDAEKLQNVKFRKLKTGDRILYCSNQNWKSIKRWLLLHSKFNDGLAILAIGNLSATTIGLVSFHRYYSDGLVSAMVANTALITLPQFIGLLIVMWSLIKCRTAKYIDAQDIALCVKKSSRGHAVTYSCGLNTAVLTKNENVNREITDSIWISMDEMQKNKIEDGSWFNPNAKSDRGTYFEKQWSTTNNLSSLLDGSTFSAATIGDIFIRLQENENFNLAELHGCVVFCDMMADEVRNRYAAGTQIGNQLSTIVESSVLQINIDNYSTALGLQNENMYLLITDSYTFIDKNVDKYLEKEFNEYKHKYGYRVLFEVLPFNELRY